jgi:hypothetical protein
MRFVDSKDVAGSIAMIAMGAGMLILYPKNLLIGQEGWIWDYPNRHVAFEHMLAAVYATLGVFLIWGARDPERYIPLINFTIVSGAIHATAMWIDAVKMPGMHNHLSLRGDVIGTYLAPIVLTLLHPRRPYWRRAAKAAT